LVLIQAFTFLKVYSLQGKGLLFIFTYELLVQVYDPFLTCPRWSLEQLVFVIFQLKDLGNLLNFKLRLFFLIVCLVLIQIKIRGEVRTMAVIFQYLQVFKLFFIFPLYFDLNQFLLCDQHLLLKNLQVSFHQYRLYFQ
jgi:hypothetical protein